MLPNVICIDILYSGVIASNVFSRKIRKNSFFFVSCVRVWGKQMIKKILRLKIDLLFENYKIQKGIKYYKLYKKISLVSLNTNKGSFF